MGMPVKIIADSTCDLSPAFVKMLDVQIIPLYITQDLRSMRDMIDIKPEDIFREFQRTKRTPTTSAASMMDFVQVFTPYAEQGRDIVYIGISEQLSATCQNARLAAETLPQVDIHIIDSASLSNGIGLLVAYAAEMSSNGCTAEEIAAAIKALVPKVRASFLIDTLDFLYRGGRCSALQAMGANVLRLKPMLLVTKGRLVPDKKYRGVIEKCAEHYTADLLAQMVDPDPRRVFICHSSAPELGKIVEDMVRQSGKFNEIITNTAGCVISSHCGPNTVGVLYIERAN